MFTIDGIEEGADGYALLQRDLAEAVQIGNSTVMEYAGR